MALVFHRQLAIPLLAVALFTVALAAPTAAALFVIVVFWIAMIAFAIPGLVPSWYASRSVVRLLLTGRPRAHSGATTVVTGAGARALDTPNPTTAEETLALLRMDDDGGWHMARPAA